MFDRDPGIEEEYVKIITTTAKGNRVAKQVKLRYRAGRIQLVGLPFGLKDEVKACLTNPKWDVEGKYWSVADDLRSRFQLQALIGENPYANWEQPLNDYQFSRSLMSHQRTMAQHCLTHHYKILAAEPGVGKSLTLIEVMEQSGVDDWWYVSTKSGCVAVEMEFEKWGLRKTPKLMTYEGLLKLAKAWSPGAEFPQAIAFDEYSRCTNSHAQRAQGCKKFADLIRDHYGWDGYVIGASGSCSPKSPVGWWMLAEIIFPGFLRENSAKAFEWRLGIFENKETSQGVFPVRVAWRDDERRCDKCGKFQFEDTDEGPVNTHIDALGIPCKDHPFTPSKNEVAYLHQRLDGLVHTVFKKDCLDLPELEYRELILPPTPTIKRAAKALATSARTTIQALTWLRALSDGFQYEVKQTDELVECSVCKGTGEYKAWEVEGDDFETWSDYAKVASVCDTCQGEGQVPKSVRESKYFKGPKQEALEGLLDKCDEHGRIIVSAGFTASIDRCVQICHNKQWDVIRIDGRGWKLMRWAPELEVDRRMKPLRYWMESPEKVAIVMHPESGGTGLTLTEAYMIVVYSNDFKPENRIQLVNRIHRPGMTRGAVIVDLLHLGTDRKVLDTLKANHKLEKLSLGDIAESV
ncbi:MAG: DEAD/DEAH box helicase [Desulfurellales bacterium]|nr:MAG: DEAD/DEAH box helicase [Desulfurellales bacterium]